MTRPLLAAAALLLAACRQEPSALPPIKDPSRPYEVTPQIRDQFAADLRAAVERMTGPAPADCGQNHRLALDPFPGEDSLRPLLKCAEERAAAKQPFWALQQDEGGHSLSASGLFGGTDGAVYRFLFSSECLRPGCRGVFELVERCDRPVIGKADGLYTLTCEGGPPRGPEAYEALAVEILKQLVEINTTPAGNTTGAAEAVAARLRGAGLPAADVLVAGAAPNRGNLVARLRGRGGGRRPIILLAHLDVVDARREDWSVDPFTFLERDGWFYGRGTTDDKDDAAIWTTTILRLLHEGYVSDRDLILALTADEEGGSHNGVDWLLQHRRDLIDAAFALNEGGDGVLKDGRRLALNVQASEKVYQSYELVVTNAGGHSSLPRADNAIVQLAAALTRIGAHNFPVRLNDVTRRFFYLTAGEGTLETPEVARAMRALVRDPADAKAIAVLSAIPDYNARLRTTCAATQIEGGHAENALPQRARAIVNCRVLPDESVPDVLTALQKVVADPAIVITPIGSLQQGPSSPLTPEIMGAIVRVTGEMWPAVPVIPTMSTGATDGVFLRRAGIPVYGVSGLFEEFGDERAHGRDERIHRTRFFEGLEFAYRLVRQLTGT